MASVTLKNIRKAFGRIETLHGVNLDIADRDFVVFVGPSGCGKSTLLRLIAGLEDITSGDLMIDGQRVNEKTPKDRGISMVFQSYALYPHMNVYQNMAFGLELAKTDTQTIDQKVREAAKILELTPLLERLPKQLSGGQRQRVAIARAVVRNPAFVVADEPVSALDMTIQKQVLELFRRLQDKHGFACLFISHDMAAVSQVADRIVVMKDGRIVEQGSVAEIFDRPQHAYTRALLEATPSLAVPQALSA